MLNRRCPYIPAWKVKRELIRIGQRAKARVMEPVWALRQARYDQRRHLSAQICDGARPLGRDIAIFVIYQPLGLSPSVFVTLDALQRSGYSPFLVLNAPVSPAEHAQLLQVSALVMTRENFGYDFGGYRDAVLHIERSGIDFDDLVFLNDSVWFPIRADCTHLDAMRNTDGELVGYTYAVDKPDRRNAHVQSYLFGFSNLDRVKRAAFFAYWRNLKVATDREFTIRKCEMRMTEHFRSAGFRVGWLFSAKDIITYLERASESDLARLVEYNVAVGHRRAREQSAALSRSKETLRQMLLTEAASGVMGRNVIGAAPGMAFEAIGLAAIKKSPALNYMTQKRLLLETCDLHKINPTILREIRAQGDAL